MERLPISLIIIAHNEAHRLPRCLDSAAPWVSEIIAVTNDCTDDTHAIFTHYGAKIYPMDWQGSNLQKQRALDRATQPWVLSLDADEEISPKLAQSIREFVRKNSTEDSSAYFARKTWFLGRWIKHGDWYPDYITRLFRREQAHFGGKQDHERIIIPGKPKKLIGDLYHYSFPTTDALIQKMPRFGNAFLKGALEKEKRWSTASTLFRTLWRFIRCYIIKLGFLDGFPGFYIAFNQAFSTFYRHARLYEHLKRNKTPMPEKTDLI